MEPFLGSFRLEKSEMFDEYLTARGVPWLIRKMMQASWITKVFEKVDLNDPPTYSLTNKSPMSTLMWKFQFGQQFEGKGFDGKMHKITFDLKDGQLHETHIRIEDAQRQDHAETYRYERQGDYLILNLQHEQINAKRFFKKQLDVSS